HRAVGVAGGELRQRGLAEDDGAGLAQLVDDEGVARRAIILEHDGAVGGRHAGGVDLVLHQDDHTMQRPDEAGGALRRAEAGCAASRRSASASASGLRLMMALMAGPCWS